MFTLSLMAQEQVSLNAREPNDGNLRVLLRLSWFFDPSGSVLELGVGSRSFLDIGVGDEDFEVGDAVGDDVGDSVGDVVGDAVARVDTTVVCGLGSSLALSLTCLK